MDRDDYFKKNTNPPVDLFYKGVDGHGLSTEYRIPEEATPEELQAIYEAMQRAREKYFQSLAPVDKKLYLENNLKVLDRLKGQFDPYPQEEMK